MKRLFVDKKITDTMIITGQDAHHILKVLRYQIGQKLIIVDPEHHVAEAEIIEVEANSFKIKCMATLDADTEPPIEVTLAQCLPKGDKLDFIVQKAVELGAVKVCPIVSENCVVKYDNDKKVKRQQKWQKIAYEASKQCGRTVVPEVMMITSLADFLAGLDSAALLIFCYESEVERSIGSLLSGNAAQKIIVLIGPEGGFTPAEAALCADHGLQAVTLGPRVLRAETAALTALSIIMYQNGDLGGRR